MAEMRTANRTQKYGIKDTSDLSLSVKASQASSKMYESMTSNLLKITDMATTTAINSEIRTAKVEGKRAGIKGTEIDQDTGEYKGYETKDGFFKWDDAFDDASIKSFENNVNAQANSFMKNLAKDVDGSKFKYDAVYNETVGNAVAGITNGEQELAIRNYYARAYNANLKGVIGDGIKAIKTSTKNAWNDSREAYVDETSILFKNLSDAKTRYADAQELEDEDAMLEATKEIDKYSKELLQTRLIREGKGSGGIKVGSLSVDGVARDTDDDIFEGYKVATIAMFREADTPESKAMIRQSINDMSTEDMSPIRKKELLKLLDEQLASDNADESRRVAEEARTLVANKRSANTIIKGRVIEYWLTEDDEPEIQAGVKDEIMKDINELWEVDYISTAERKGYIDMLENGDTVEESDPLIYGEILNNIDDYDAEAIGLRNDLTFQSKKELMNLRKEFNEGALWMKPPAYRKARDVIRSAFGFTEKSLLGESLDHKGERRRIEMNDIVTKYREEVVGLYNNEKPINHLEIADRLIEEAKQNTYSSIYKKTQPYEKSKRTVKQLETKASRNKATIEKTISDFKAKGGTVVDEKNLSKTDKVNIERDIKEENK